MGTVLGMIAVHGRAGVTEFDEHWRDPAVTALCARVTMRRDAEVDAAYPARWIGKVEVKAATVAPCKRGSMNPRATPATH